MAMASDDDPQGSAPSSEFGPILRHWRQTRGLSQQGLAERAGMSTRHLSFLETGRCGPSRAAVLQLAKALDVPHAEIERLLLVAGYAGDWTRCFGDPVAIRRQLERVSHLLAAHDPFPALITDPDWRLGWANRGAQALLRRFQEFRPDLCIEPLDLRELFADTRGFEALIANWSDLLEAIVAGLYQLEPDPSSFGNTRSLMEVLPHCERPGAAIERASSAALWHHQVRIRDRGVEFGMELLPLPFASCASGYALVLTHPADAESAPIAREYFSKLAGLPPRS